MDSDRNARAPVEVFLSYARADRDAVEPLRKRLRQFEIQGEIRLFIDDEMEPGTTWKPEILDALRRAPIVLVIVSNEFLASEWIYEHELPEIMDRHGQGGAQVLPVLLDACGWKHSRVSELQLVSHTPVTKAEDSDHEWGHVATVVRDRAAALRAPAEPATAPDPVAQWRAYLRTAHSRLVPFFPEARSADLSEVFVELEVLPEREQPDRLAGEHRGSPSGRNDDASEPDKLRFGRPLTLRQLLELPSSEPGRWVVVGDPGAGKSTVARHLAWELAGEPEGPIPVYVSIQRWLDFHGNAVHPFALAESDLREACDAVRADGLANALHERAQVSDSTESSDRRSPLVWLLLDGLDEVDPASVEHARRQIETMAEELPGVSLVVLSRPVGLTEPAGFRRANLSPLPAARRQTLIAGWVGAEKAKEVWGRIEKQPVLLELTGNPLLLTLVCMLALREPHLPPNRSSLYQAATELLLTRGFGSEPKSVTDPRSARRLLSVLALELQSRESVTFTPDELDDTLIELITGDSKLETRLKVWGSSPTRFLEDIATNAGILAPHDGPREPWRFLHRAL
ncbi:MAG: TIR domain-containing protein, partial [Planctomycetes bacterium]|nr:TIR domain-containing protein [Planctomycetota bacterium]